VNHRSLVIVGALAAVLAGCGGSSNADKGPASALALCEKLVPAIGATLMACDTGGLPEPVLAPLLAIDINCQNFQEAQAAGRITFDQAKAKGCVDSLPTLTCAAFAAGGDILTPACLEAIKPTVAPGGLCTSNIGIECVAGFCDQSVSNACTAGGRCVTSATLGQACAAPARCASGLICDIGTTTCVTLPATTILPVGGNCTALYNACADGLYCNTSGSPRLCTPKGAAGAACSLTAPCLGGFACDTATSRCLARPRLGEPCVQGQGKCAGNTYCGAGNSCIASPTLGGDCRLSAGESVVCQDSWCPPAVAPSTARTCTAFATPGGICQMTNQLQCGYAYRCAATSGTVGVCGRNYCGG
jgi:hypothetical protein